MEITRTEVPCDKCLKVLVSVPPHEEHFLEGLHEASIEKKGDTIEYGVIVADNHLTQQIVHMLKRLEYRDIRTPPELGNSTPESYINKLLRALDIFWD